MGIGYLLISVIGAVCLYVQQLAKTDKSIN